ncbi:hypothetical protein PTKIN_Ptkin14bG0188000 [Pterospermum kingtungense]
MSGLVLKEGFGTLSFNGETNRTLRVSTLGFLQDKGSLELVSVGTFSIDQVSEGEGKMALSAPCKGCLSSAFQVLSLAPLSSCSLSSSLMDLYLWALLTGSLCLLDLCQGWILGSNNFYGELPATFANLTTLTDFWIADNNFTGRIPNFIFQNWTKLEKLIIQASGLSGPIPDIVGLQNLTDLRISDLNGAEAKFPQLSDLPNLKRLILRSCNLVGWLPDSVWDLTKVKILDLSFNKLSGEIRSTLPSPNNLYQVFLNGNRFTGPIPQWILETNKEMNLFASTSGIINNSGIVSCLGTPRCPAEPLHSLHINCGGRQETVNNITYEADSDKAGPSLFFLSPKNWAFSSTGVFLDDHKVDSLVFTLLNNTQLSKNYRQLYSTARLSPTSLTYYAFCLKNLVYNVSLHFAEIQFTDDKTFSSLGRRVFDVYIQEKLELKDFNIKDEAGGIGKPILKNFTANVTDGTLNIRLQWAGKGSTSIPTRGVDGPLISAISVFDPHYKPPSGKKGGICSSLVIGIVAGAAFAALMLLGVLWWNGCLRRELALELSLVFRHFVDNAHQYDLKGTELQTSSFSLWQIKAATNNFAAANKIGEGGFGPVYKGILADGTAIAVKQLSARSRQGNHEFVTEIGMISALQHPHLVKLLGCCIEGNQLLLIYEYLKNNSLARALFGPEKFQLRLDWPTRRKICIGLARGLAYLHEESRLKVVHRDIKATNVLLDKDLNAKISDFGLAKLHEEDNTHISTRIAGTYGYMAPEYAMHGRLSDKADVYSFGIVALEIVSGVCNTQHGPNGESVYLLDWACILKERGNLLDLIDPRIVSDCNIEEVKVMIDVALLCTDFTPPARPSMSSVVSMLEGRATVQDFITETSSFKNEFNSEAMKKLFRHIGENNEENSQTKTHILKEKGKLLDLIDPRIGCDCNIEEVKVMIEVAFLCTNPTAAARPCMSSVVSMLEGRAAVEEFITESSSLRMSCVRKWKKMRIARQRVC